MKSIFPEGMLNISGGELSLDVVKAKMNYFELQLHELHWQTKVYSEHICLGSLYDKVYDLKDEIVEKIMGYTGVRTKAMPVDPIKNYSPGMSTQVVSELLIFAKQLENYASANNMPDIENIAQGLSGLAAQTKYLLTMS
jgi:DNA-binding ferritin-like protein